MKKAQNLDPLSLIINADLAELLLIEGLSGEAIDQSRKTIEMDSSFVLAHNQLGQAYLKEHMFPEAISELQGRPTLWSQPDIHGQPGQGVCGIRKEN